MNATTHLAEAEDCLSCATNAEPDAAHEDVAMLLTFAQVHATLALAYATAEAKR